MQQANDTNSPDPPDDHPTSRRPLLRALAGAGALGVLGLPHASRAARAAIAGVDIEYKRCKVAFVSHASALDAIAVYYADRNDDRHARYDVAPTVTDPRGYDPLVVEYDSDEDRTQIQIADPQGSLVCVIAEAGADRTVLTNPTEACVPTGFNTAPSASFDVSDDPTVGEPVTFSSTASDPDSPERLFYDWDLDGDGSFEVSGETVTTTFETPGEKTVRHRVTDDCGSSDTVVRTITVASSALFEQVTKLAPTDLDARDRFGRWVSIDGDTALIGAEFGEGGDSREGVAYVFERDQGGADAWGQVAKLTAPDGESSSRFGRSVSIAGDTALVGARGQDEQGNPEGKVYIFERDRGGIDTWGQVTKLTAPDSDASDSFGGAVSIDGDTALVGERNIDPTASAAYVFERDQDGTDTWGQVAKLTASNGSNLDRFGFIVRVDGDTALVGTPGDDEQGLDAGAAYVFRRDRGGIDTWGQVAKLTASDGEANDSFSASVSIDGDTVLVGTPGDDDQGSAAGAVYVFGRNQGGPDNWGEVTKLTASDGEAGDVFGAVSIAGGTVLVGAPGEDEQGSSAGAAYIFE